MVYDLVQFAGDLEGKRFEPFRYFLAFALIISSNLFDRIILRNTIFQGGMEAYFCVTNPIRINQLIQSLMKLESNPLKVYPIHEKQERRRTRP